MPRITVIPQEPTDIIKHPHFHQTYKYDNKKKVWEFVGFRCIRCGDVFKKQNTVESHTITCKYIITTENMAKRDVENKPYTITPTGQLWKPLDFNQKFSEPK